MKTLLACDEFVAKPRAEVFAALADFERASERVSGIERVEMLTPGPVRVGTRFRETRKMFGKEATEEMTVVALEEGRRYVLGCTSCGMRMESEVRVTDEPGGTRVTMECRGKGLTLGARVMGAIFGWMLRGTMTKAIRADLRDIKTWLEAH